MHFRMVIGQGMGHSKRAIKGYEVFIRVSFDDEGTDGCIEHLWAERTFGGYRIVNIPFSARTISFGDVVRIDEATGEILSVVRPSNYRNGLVGYGSDSDPAIRDRFKRLRLALEENGIIAAGMTPGVASLAVPKDISEEDFWKIVTEIPEITAAELFEKNS